MNRIISYSRAFPILTAVLFAAVTFTYLGTTIAFAQSQSNTPPAETTETVVSDSVEVFDFGVLATLGGIVAIAVPLTSLAKRGAAKVPYLKDIPTVVYAWAIASGLTVVSWWLGYMQVLMETPQDWVETLASVSITASLLSVGAHGTAKNVLKTPASKFGTTASLLLVGCVLFMGGCQATVDADRAAAYSNTFGHEYSEVLEGEFDPDDLTDVEREGRLRYHKVFNDYANEAASDKQDGPMTPIIVTPPADE